ncbi:hypothetical protein BJ875DRAFT_476496 [Amylocarpus encephaloides]|uniref:Uncharacterized protein n=1 Tax=Amylocarpus encephaloides TaxID=45428 RepID=A0A9P7Y818_9HELO|nr:hypothetical protein BJ875DRAFT_476496 [Amylocarpus encephaloides]
MVAGTLLQGRDQAPPSFAPPSIAISRHSTIQAPPPKAFAETKSILASPTDVHMASRQTSFMEMSPDRQKIQEEWAQKQLDKYDTGCPQSYKWLRVDGGYQCQGGFHCVTDALLEEGKGGMMAFPQGSSTVWGVDVWKGPYYRDENIKRWRLAK